MLATLLVLCCATTALAGDRFIEEVDGGVEEPAPEEDSEPDAGTSIADDDLTFSRPAPEQPVLEELTRTEYTKEAAKLHAARANGEITRAEYKQKLDVLEKRFAASSNQRRRNAAPGMEADPCDGVTCTEHSVCVAVHGAPRCSCDYGLAWNDDGTRCIDPHAKTEPTATAVDKASSARFALGAGIFGMTATAGMLALGVTHGVKVSLSSKYSDPELYTIVAGLVGQGTTVISGALVSTALQGDNTTGVLGLRSAAWLLYGAGVTTVMLDFFALGSGAWIPGVGAVFLAQLLVAIDALVIYRDLTTPKTAEEPDPPPRRRRRVVLRPSLAPLSSENGVTGALAGLGGTF